MDSWEDALYDAKKDFYRKSSMSPEHMKLKKALETVEKEIKPISRELEDKKKENDHLKAALADANTQLRLLQYQKDKEIDVLRKEFNEKIVERLKEKELINQSETTTYEQRIVELQNALQEAQSFTGELQAQQRSIEHIHIDSIQKILDNERLENTLTLKRKDDEIQSFQDRLIQKEEYIASLNQKIHELETRHFESQKQWIQEVSFSREILKKTIEEMDALQQEYMQRDSTIIENIQKQLLDSKKQLAELEKDLPGQQVKLLQMEVKEKESIMQESTQRIAALQTEMEQMRRTPEPPDRYAEEKNALNTRITDMEQKLRASIEENGSLRDTLSQHEHDLSVYRQQIAVLDASASDRSDQKLRDLENTLASVSTTNESLRHETVEKNTVIATLRQQVQQLENNLHQARQIPPETVTETTAGHFTFIPRMPAIDTETTPLKKKTQRSVRIFKTYPRTVAAVLAVMAIGISVMVVHRLFISGKTGKTIDTSFKASQQNPSALIWDGLTFWSADWFAKKIFKHKPHSLTDIAQTIQFDSMIPTTMTWGEGVLWVADAWAHTISQVTLDDHFTIDAEFQSPGPNPSGLAWDGTHVWSCDAETKKIYMHDPHDALRILKTYKAPGNAPSGLLWDGDTLWSSDATGILYRHYMDGDLSVASAYQPRDYQDGNDKLIGFTWDGKYFWTVGEQSGYFYQHNIHDMIRK